MKRIACAASLVVLLNVVPCALGAKQADRKALLDGVRQVAAPGWPGTLCVFGTNAFVVVPGGVGTMLELSLAWQLLQVRKLYATPLILIGKMWAELVDWGRRSMLEEGNELASPVDFTIPHCVSDIDEAVALIRVKREEWLRVQAAPKV